MQEKKVQRRGILDAAEAYEWLSKKGIDDRETSITIGLNMSQIAPIVRVIKANLEEEFNDKGETIDLTDEEGVAYQEVRLTKIESLKKYKKAENEILDKEETVQFKPIDPMKLDGTIRIPNGDKTLEISRDTPSSIIAKLAPFLMD